MTRIREKPAAQHDQEVSAETATQLGQTNARSQTAFADYLNGLQSDQVAGESTATIVGLTRGDGMNWATRDKRPAVKVLQQRLNAALDKGENWVDGKFGPMTGRELREFQASIRQPSAEVVDQLSADALFGQAPPGSAPAGAGPVEVPEPDRAAWTLMQGALTTLPQHLDTVRSGLMDTGLALAGSGDGMLQQSVTDFITASETIKTGLPDAFSAAELANDLGMIETAGHSAIGNTLVGLERGDGLVAGSFHRRGRVEALQTQLNKVASAGLDVDGKFGKHTTEALLGFQAKRGLESREIVGADTADHLMDQSPHVPPAGGALAQQFVNGGHSFMGAAGGALAARDGFGDAAAMINSPSPQGFDFGRSQAIVPLAMTQAGMQGVADALGQASDALTKVAHGPVGLQTRAQLRGIAQHLQQVADRMLMVGHFLQSAGTMIMGGHGAMDSHAGMGIFAAGGGFDAMVEQLSAAAPALHSTGATGAVGEVG